MGSSTGPVGSRAGSCGKLYRGLWEAMQGPVGSRAGGCGKSYRGLWEVVQRPVESNAGNCGKSCRGLWKGWAGKYRPWMRKFISI